jgi:CRISPR/Cas system type I-B associated protein Csh2 (Cas7 group RAMP superfamily)
MKKKVRIFATEIVTHIFTVDEDRFDEEFKKICNDRSFLTKETDSKSYQKESYLKCVETE